MTKRKQYFIKIHERAVEVSHEVYLAYFRMERQERYLEEEDRKKAPSYIAIWILTSCLVWI